MFPIQYDKIKDPTNHIRDKSKTAQTICNIMTHSRQTRNGVHFCELSINSSILHGIINLCKLIFIGISALLP